MDSLLEQRLFSTTHTDVDFVLPQRQMQVSGKTLPQKEERSGI
jgi:hypothetical protein